MNEMATEIIHAMLQALRNAIAAQLNEESVHDATHVVPVCQMSERNMEALYIFHGVICVRIRMDAFVGSDAEKMLEGEPNISGVIVSRN